MTHSVDYKGVTIHCENGLYYIATLPCKKYFSFQEAKKEVDKVNNTLHENIINLKEIIKRK